MLARTAFCALARRCRKVVMRNSLASTRRTSVSPGRMLRAFLSDAGMTILPFWLMRVRVSGVLATAGFVTLTII
jgi:hypothetical protein